LHIIKEELLKALVLQQHEGIRDLKTEVGGLKNEVASLKQEDINLKLEMRVNKQLLQ
jgi:hypothetical protein